MTRILVIDDDEQVRSSLRMLLERSGYEVVEAPNGKIGMKLFKEEPTDLIITDLIMPEKEGIETIIELKESYPDIKIIAISGGGRNEPEYYLQLADKLGAKRTFSKPFKSDELLGAIEELLH